ncbi:phosphate ABC transporter permease PstA [Allostreptomyces psammosilenae]|uniref:Phosphate transport system permease protein PstA n=1 Tax=Allostreptomyces psammosilenae TaxID=1892865 RepID=A0A852ZYH3_9ACTN|nr:phosphate ABC transporter permease PstA [Allostreptomyces psammosilenae]NYI06280.1 phosphate transport system permease protein [Allostreptomyces psammosilenae]
MTTEQISDRRAAAVHPTAPAQPAPATARATAATTRRTVLPAVDRPHDAPAAPPTRRATGGLDRDDLILRLGSAAASLSLTALLFGRILPFDGWQGFLVVAGLLFLGIYAVLVMQEEDGPAVRDRVMAAVIQAIAAVLLICLGMVIVFTVARGWEALSHLNFFTQDMGPAGPLDPLSVGGIQHAIVGTLIQISIALAITIPLGITCAVFLGEVGGRFARFVRTIAEAMTALPSIVAGLFVYALFITTLGLERSGLAASMAITVMMLPIVIRAADVVLRLVPGNLREASLALGASQWRTVWHVVLPTARSGLTTSVILGTARGVGETSPVLLTAGSSLVLNLDPARNPMISLPLAAYEFTRSPEPTMIARGFGTAATLMVLVLVLFVFARILGGRGAGQLSRRQQRRAARASQRDVERFRLRGQAPASPSRPAAAPADR